MPEEISNRDGGSKQDCENNAAKRALKLFRKDHPKLKAILVAKPSDHKSMFGDIEGLRLIDGVNECVLLEQNGEKHSYEWVNEIMLNGNNKSIKVNYLGYVCTKGDKIIYRNSWVTDFTILIIINLFYYKRHFS